MFYSQIFDEMSKSIPNLLKKDLAEIGKHDIHDCIVLDDLMLKVYQNPSFGQCKAIIIIQRSCICLKIVLKKGRLGGVLILTPLIFACTEMLCKFIISAAKNFPVKPIC